MQYINMDGREYKVRVVYGSLQRSFRIAEGRNSGTSITGKVIRDILGTRYAYEMDIEADIRFPKDYDDFFDAVSAPVDSHSIKMPYGQDVLEFDAEIESGSDTFAGKIGGFNRWGKLHLIFSPISPQRRDL